MGKRKICSSPDLNQGPLDRKSSALTTRPWKQITKNALNATKTESKNAHAIKTVSKNAQSGTGFRNLFASFHVVFELFQILFLYDNILYVKGIRHAKKSSVAMALPAAENYVHLLWTGQLRNRGWHDTKSF